MNIALGDTTNLSDAAEKRMFEILKVHSLAGFILSEKDKLSHPLLAQRKRQMLRNKKQQWKSMDHFQFNDNGKDERKRLPERN